ASSLCPGLALNGAILSKEDHGFVVDLGIEGLHAFLETKEADQEDYVIGQLVRVVVLKIVSKRVVHLSSLPEKVNPAMLPALAAIEMEQLVAGALVHGRVTAVSDSGLKVVILGIFEATIELSHCTKSADVVDSFKVGQKLKSRIVWVDDIAKCIGLSLLDHFLAWQRVTFTATIGEIKDNVEVVKMDSRMGLLMQWTDDQLGFAHISRIKDEPLAKIPDSHGFGTHHKARVIGLDYCNHLVQLSLQPKILAQPFVRLEDIKVASIIKGVVEKIESFGLIVAVTDSIRGLCPTAHLSDANLTHPEKFFKVGGSVSFRVLSVDLEKRRLLLTHKKSLMESTNALILSYDQVQLGDIVTGVITKVQDYGCIVSFFNNVHALAPMAELAHEKIDSAASLFKVGQSVKCRVIAVSAAESKMKVSFKVSQIAFGKDIAVGFVSTATFASAGTRGIVVHLSDTGHSASISIPHLHDSIAISEKIFKALSTHSKKNIDLGKVVVTAVDTAKGTIHASMKGLLVDHAEKTGTWPSLDSIHEGDLLPAVVTNVTETLCFVQLGSVTAAANVHHISDVFLAKITDGVKIGQTVLAVVAAVDRASGRISVTLKPSRLPAQAASLESTYLAGLFSGNKVLAQASGKGSVSWTSKFPIGAAVEGKVEQIMPYGVSVSLGSKVTGLVVSPELKVAPGDSIRCRVIDVNIASRIVDLAHFTEAEIDHKKLKKSISSAKQVEATVLMVKDLYVVFKVDSLGSAICFGPARPMNTPSVAPSHLKVGQKQMVTLTSLENVDVPRILACYRGLNQTPAKSSGAEQSIKDAVDPSLLSLDDLEIGSVVTAQIQSVKATHLKVKLAANLHGRIQLSEIYDDFDKIPNLKKPLQGFVVGAEIKCKILGFYSLNSNRLLPISHPNSTTRVGTELTIKPSAFLETAAVTKNQLTLDDIAVGSSYIGFVHKVDKDMLRVQILPSLIGVVDALHSSLDIAVVSNLEKNFVVGQAVKCTAISVDVAKWQLDLSLVERYGHEVGDLITARITQIDPKIGIMTIVGKRQFGRLALAELDDEFVDRPTDKFAVGQYVQAKVLAKNDRRLDLSLRSKLPTFDELHVGQIVQGYITNISEAGCLVNLFHNATARVKLTELSDDSDVDWKAEFKIGKLVVGVIMNIFRQNNRIEL
ncbi:Protein RRP5, partial [Kappamyces sp. JEL0680]